MNGANIPAGDGPDVVVDDEEQEILLQQCNRFIQARWVAIRKHCRKACERNYKEIAADRDRFETFVADASHELGARFMRASPQDRADLDLFFRRQLPNLMLEARRSADGADGRYMQPKRSIVKRPPRWILDVAPRVAQREALLEVWYHAGGYGPDEPDAIPYRRVAEKHGIEPQELSQILADLEAADPAAFQTQFGAGLMARQAQRGMPTIEDGVEIEIEYAETDFERVEAERQRSYTDELAVAADLVVSGEASSAEDALRRLIGDDAADEFSVQPEWAGIVEMIERLIEESQE